MAQKKKKVLNLDIKEAIQEMSKAPGGNVAKPRPVTPGPILGGPKEEYKPGVLDPASGVRTRRDTAIELFRFYAYGDVKERELPPSPPDTKKVTVTEKPMSQKEKIYKQTLKKSGKLVQPTQERINTAKGVRAGTIGGMTRPVGSKPPISLESNLKAAAEAARIRYERRQEAEAIRDALQKAMTADYVDRIPTRDEQKYIDLLQRRIQDANLERNAALMEALAERGQLTPTLDEVIAMRQAEQRTLEGRQVAERNKKSRAKTEKSLKDLPGKFIGKGGSGLASLDLISMILNANLMYEQMLLEQSRMKKQIS